MSKSKLLCLMTIVATLILSILLVIVMQIGVVNPPPVKETTGIVDLSGNNVAATRISDLATLNTLPFAMFTPDEFVKPGQNPGQLDNEKRITIDSSPRSDQRGTYRFVILNLDPLDNDFDKNAAAMEPYLKGDNAYHFTLYLPAVWSACTIYVDMALRDSVGEIADYNFIDYSNYVGETVYHKSETQPLFIDLSFYSKRSNIPPSKPIIAARIVTIHFETNEGYAGGGLTGMPLIGSDSVVRSLVNRDKAILAAVSLFAILIFAMFVFLCFLKHTLRYLPQQFVVFGILGIFITCSALMATTGSPYLWQAAKNFFYALIPLATMLSLRVKIKSFPLWLPFSVFATAVCAFACAIPFLSAPIAYFKTWFVVIGAVESAMILALVVFCVINDMVKPTLLINPLIAAVFTAIAAILPHTLFASPNSLFWLLFIMLIISTISSFRMFYDIELKNHYLTDNLQKEVARQTDVLKLVIGERDQLIRRTSHDMKKPLRSINQFLNILKERELNSEQLKTIAIISQKTDALIDELKEIENYASLNFAAEQSTVFNVQQVLAKTFEALNPDCEANGIIFEKKISKIQVYAKPNCLSSILNNLVINALEHSSCTMIMLSASKKKGFCHISVTDDGRGIDQGKNVFVPYYSENDSVDNLGLGLYICRSLSSSMGGDLFFTQSNGKLTFTVTVPLI